MGKGKPKPLKLKKLPDPDRARRIRAAWAHGFLALLLLGGVGAGYFYANQFVRQKVAYTTQPLIIVLKNRPPWMNDFLVEQIALIARPTGAHSSFDHELLEKTTALLLRNPWVRKVRSVRRAYTHRPGDTLELDCEYRAPVALVKFGSLYWLVDESGVRLSEPFTEQNVPNIQFDPGGHTVIRVIEGVRQPAPHFAGEKWPGDDLAAGLNMVKYLFDRPYAEDILRVNVSNFAGREENKNPQIVLETKYQTQIWWGRPPSGDDVDSFLEVSSARKLEYLKWTVEQEGRVDGKHRWLDIRFDKVTYPPDEQTIPAPHPSQSRTSR